MTIETVNRALFQALNAPGDLSGLPLALAIAAAKYAIVALAALLAYRWIRGSASERSALVHILLLVLPALALNYAVGLAFPHPRPFMIGLGHTFIPHQPESSFPSDHATLMWTVALGMLLWLPSKAAGWFAVVLAALTGWARVFVGLHFPFDIVGSIAVAGVAVGMFAALRRSIERTIAPPIERLWAAARWRILQICNRS